MSSVASIVCIGKSGTGKSLTGNIMLKDPKAFKTAGGVHGVTTDPIRKVNIAGTFAVTDTGGLGDSDGRTICMLDKTMTHIKNHPPTVIGYYIDSGRADSSVVNCLKILRHCFKPSVLSEVSIDSSRFFLIINRLKTKGDIYATGVQRDAVDQVRNNKRLVSEHLGINVTNVVKVPYTQDLAIRVGPIMERMVEHIERISSAGGPIDTKQCRTFTAVLREARAYADQTIKADDCAQRKYQQLGCDIQWHRNRIRDMKITMAATGWIPFVRIGTLTGCGIAIADSERKIPELETKRKNIFQNKVRVFRKARAEAKQILADAEAMEDWADKRCLKKERYKQKSNSRKSSSGSKTNV